MNGDQATGIAAHVVARSPADGLSDELRRYLVSELPPHMVPTKFFLHDSLPRNAAGKVDRFALRYSLPKTAADEIVVDSGNDVRESLAQLWCKALSLDSCALKEATFWDLGGDSMGAVQLMLDVHDLIGQRLPVSSFLINPTLSGLEQVVDDLIIRGTTPVLEFRRQGNRHPLFCLYGAWGDVGVYTQLAEALGDDQPVFGVRSPSVISGEIVPGSLEEAAATIVSLMRSTTDDPRPAVLGYSWGGLLAFEVARQWTNLRGQQPFVGIIGALPPLHHVTNRVRFLHFIRWFPRAVWHVLHERRTWKKRLFRIRELAHRTLATMRPKTNHEPPLPYWVNNPISRAHLELSNRYHPDVSIPIELHLVREVTAFTSFPHPLRPLDRSHLPDCGWSVWSKQPVVVHLIDAEHRDVMRPPKVDELAGLLREAMNGHYGPSSQPIGRLQSTDLPPPIPEWSGRNG